jgi:hypothetical protein
VQAVARLALIRARSTDILSALENAETAAAELAKGPVGPKIVEATVRGLIGQAFRLTAAKAAGADRAARSAQARLQLDDSARLWREAVLPASLEPKRTRALAQLDHDRLTPDR